VFALWPCRGSGLVLHPTTPYCCAHDVTLSSPIYLHSFVLIHVNNAYINPSSEHWCEEETGLFAAGEAAGERGSDVSIVMEQPLSPFYLTFKLRPSARLPRRALSLLLADRSAPAFLFCS